MKTIRVVAAIIIDHDKVFATQRGYGEFKDGWEFPGGKIEPGESPENALVREIKEELNIEPINPELMGIYSGKELFNIYPKSKDQVYVLNHVFFCEEYKGKIEFIDGEVKDLKWFDLDNLPENIFKINKPIINDVKKFVETHKIIVN